MIKNSHGMIFLKKLKIKIQKKLNIFKLFILNKSNKNP